MRQRQPGRPGGSSRPSMGTREVLVERVVKNPKYFVQLECLSKSLMSEECSQIFSQEELDDYKKEVLALGVDVISMQQHATHVDESAERIKAGYSAQDENIPTAAALEKLLQEAVDSQAVSNPENAPAVLKIKQIFAATEEDEDVEIHVMETEDNEATFRCPISHELMRAPVKNSKCGHRFSEAGFEQWRKSARTDRSGFMRCPMPGCNKMFKFADVVADEEFKYRVSRWMRTQETQSQSTTEGMTVL